MIWFWSTDTEWQDLSKT